MSGGWVYIMTNRPNGVLYTGVTSDIGRGAYEHREALVPGFTKRYGLAAAGRNAEKQPPHLCSKIFVILTCTA
jgi:predicted GIY-YIG superfamily endonuclease